MRKEFFGRCMLVALLAFVASCGGTGSGADGSGGGSGGGSITGNVPAYKSMGSIDALGSIVVNGVKFDIDEAKIIIDGREVDDKGGLKVGMKVEVEGEINDDRVTGRATGVRFSGDVKGEIESIDDASAGFLKKITVMGQSVVVEDGVAHFDDRGGTLTFASLGDSRVGEVVEVAGCRNPDDSIRATFIQKKADDAATFLAGDAFEVKGTISNLSANTFTIGNLTINFNGLTPRNLEAAPGGVLADGIAVEVKGKVLSGNILTATDLEVKAAGLGFDDLPEAEIEGPIEGLDATNQTFMVGGQKIDFSAASFEGGVSADLANGVEVEAEGPIVGGVLMALKIKFREDIRFEANADVIDAAASTLTLQALPGIVIMADPVVTEFKDVAQLSAIAPGSNLKIRGRMAEGQTNKVIATRIELKQETPDKRLIIQGRASGFDAATGIITILGIDIDTSALKDGEFKDQDVVIGRAAFASAFKIGSIVKARFDIDLATLATTLKEIEFEN